MDRKTIECFLVNQSSSSFIFIEYCDKGVKISSGHDVVKC